MEIKNVEMIEEFKNRHNEGEAYVLSKVEYEDGTVAFEAQHEIDGVAGHTENEYFGTEEDARDYINENNL